MNTRPCRIASLATVSEASTLVSCGLRGMALVATTWPYTPGRRAGGAA